MRLRSYYIEIEDKTIGTAYWVKHTNLTTIHF